MEKIAPPIHQAMASGRRRDAAGDERATDAERSLVCGS
jgi:hypothetical protein